MHDCREFFVFDSAGGILPSQEPPRAAQARNAVKTLGLDIPKLVAMRRAAIDGALALLDEAANDEEIRQFITVIDSRDTEGKHTPFASAVVQILSAYLPPPPLPPGDEQGEASRR
jgi:hypothetical protein